MTTTYNQHNPKSKHFVSGCISTLLLFATPAFAWLCPSNFKSVQAGDTQDIVKQLCGSPSSTKELPAEKKQVPEQWDYVIQNNNRLDNRSKQNNKLSLLFDANGKLVNMTLDGTSINQSSACTNPFRVGDQKDAIKRSCGAPSFILQSQSSEPAATTETTSVLWVYETPTGTTRFLFKNGILTDRQ